MRLQGHRAEGRGYSRALERRTEDIQHKQHEGVAIIQGINNDGLASVMAVGWGGMVGFLLYL